MTIVGVRDLKNKLPQYLDMVKKGGRIIVTDRGTSIAVINDLTGLELSADQEEILAFLATAGKLRLPKRRGGVKHFNGVSLNKGKSVTETVIEGRR